MAELEVPDSVLHLPGGRTHRVRPAGRIDVPLALAHLDVDDAGVAVPWMLPRTALGATDLDKAAARQVMAMRRQLCGICGFELDYRKCFHVSAPDEAAARGTRNMVAPALHLPCSDYAADAYGARTDPDATWWRYACRSYRLRETADGQLVAVAAPATTVTRL